MGGRYSKGFLLAIFVGVAWGVVERRVVLHTFPLDRLNSTLQSQCQDAYECVGVWVGGCVGGCLLTSSLWVFLMPIRIRIPIQILIRFRIRIRLRSGIRIIGRHAHLMCSFVGQRSFECEWERTGRARALLGAFFTSTYTCVCVCVCKCGHIFVCGK